MIEMGVVTYTFLSAYRLITMRKHPSIATCPTGCLSALLTLAIHPASATEENSGIAALFGRTTALFNEPIETYVSEAVPSLFAKWKMKEHLA